MLKSLTRTFIISLSIFLFTCCLSVPAALSATYGWAGLADFGYVTDYNLFLSGDLRYQNSDIQGRAAIGGNARLTSFSIGEKADKSDYSLVVGGRLSAGGRGDADGGQVNNGGILAGGNAKLTRVGIPQGDVRSGGKLKLESLTVENGAVEANGNVRIKEAFVSRGVTSGGNVKVKDATVGSITASNNVRLKRSAVLGDVNAGGRVKLVESSVLGDINAGGRIKLKSSGVQGGVHDHTAVSDTVLNHQDVQLFDFSSISLGSLSSALWQESSSIVNLNADSGDVLELNAGSGFNYFKVLADDMMAASGIFINAPSDAVVVINVYGSPEMEMHNMAFSLSGGIRSGNVIYNLRDAEDIELYNLTLLGSLLAPDAHVSFYSGVLEGILMAESLYGGEVDPFDGLLHSVQINQPGMPVPIPGTVFLLVPGLAILFFIRKWLSSDSI